MSGDYIGGLFRELRREYEDKIAKLIEEIARQQREIHRLKNAQNS